MNHLKGKIAQKLSNNNYQLITIWEGFYERMDYLYTSKQGKLKWCPIEKCVRKDAGKTAL